MAGGGQGQGQAPSSDMQVERYTRTTSHMHTHMASANAFLIISSHWHCCLHIQGALPSQCSAPLPPIAPTSTSAPRGSLELRRLVCPPAIGQAPGPEGMSGCERVTRGSLGAGGSSIQQPWLVRYQRRAIQHGKVRGQGAGSLALSHQNLCDMHIRMFEA